MNTQSISALLDEHLEPQLPAPRPVERVGVAQGEMQPVNLIIPGSSPRWPCWPSRKLDADAARAAPRERA
jgi:hypothetical protein